MFNDIICVNIVFGWLDVIEEEIVEVVKVVVVYDFIKDMLKVYDIKVGDCGFNLSGG